MWPASMIRMAAAGLSTADTLPCTSVVTRSAKGSV